MRGVGSIGAFLIGYCFVSTVALPEAVGQSSNRLPSSHRPPAHFRQQFQPFSGLPTGPCDNRPCAPQMPTADGLPPIIPGHIGPDMVPLPGSTAPNIAPIYPPFRPSTGPGGQEPEPLSSNNRVQTPPDVEGLPPVRTPQPADSGGRSPLEEITPENRLTAPDGNNFPTNNLDARPDFRQSQSTFASSGSSYGANMIGDLPGSGAVTVALTELIPYTIVTQGTTVSGGPTNPNSVLVFEANGGSPDDFFTVGPGQDLDGSNDGNIDTFSISEPLAPNEVATSPGSGYAYDGGTAVSIGNNPLATAPQSGPFADGSSWYASYSFSRTSFVTIPAAGGVGLRRLKLSENNNPMPQDRLLFDYSFFRRVPGGVGDVNRFQFGGEKTFWDGMASWELRAPFAGTLNTTQYVDGRNFRATEFGNVNLTLKGLLASGCCHAISGGMGFTFPTADDTRLYRDDNALLLELRNESVHYRPFLAALWRPSDRRFIQTWVHLDIDGNGNTVRGDARGQDIAKIGELNDATLLYADISMGYWMFQNRCHRLIQSLAPVLELHYTTTVQDEDVVLGRGFNIRSETPRSDIFNITAGTQMVLSGGKTLTPAFAFPLRSGHDKRFDYEFILQANWMF